MKILHVIPSVAPVRGGPSQAVYEMALAIGNQSPDVEIEIVTTNDNGETILDVPLETPIEYNGIRTRFFPRFETKASAIQEFSISASLVSWLWKNIRAYDLVHVHAIFSFPSTAAMVSARLQQVPYIVRPLGQLCEWSLSQSKLRKDIYLKLIERKNLSGSAQLHFTSLQEQEEASQLDLNCDSFIAPHGLDIPKKIEDAHRLLREHFGISFNSHIILFLSRIHEKKGLEFLIPALATIREYDYKFILAGSGESSYEDEIWQLIESNGLQDKVIMAGFVEGNLKQLLLQGSDLFVLTSYSENFGVSVLESLAAGTPALVSPGVALSLEVDRHKLGYVVSQDINDIADMLAFHLDRSACERNEQRKRAEEFIASNYTWSENAEKMMQIYVKTLANTPKL